MDRAGTDLETGRRLSTTGKGRPRRDAVGALIFQAQREMALVRKQEQTFGNAPTASLLGLPLVVFASLKHGGMSFEQFLKLAKEWAEDEPQPFDRPLFQAILG